MNELLRLCRLDEIEDPGSRGFEGGQIGAPWDFFVVRRGELAFAYRNHCPHTGAPLDWSPDRFLDMENSFIQCAIHGALFRVEDGYCVRGPCTGQGLEPVTVSLRDGWVTLDTSNSNY